MNDVSVMPSEIKIAVIGFGFMGRTHVSAFSGIPRCRIAAVVDREPQRMARGLADTGNIETGAMSFDFDHESVEIFESVERLLAGFEFDLGIVTTPTPTHFDIASSLIESGHHVLVEKPVSLELALIRRLELLARERGVIAMPAHCMRFWPAWNWMFNKVRTEVFGPPLHASFVRTGAAPSWNSEFYLDPDKSGGAIVDLHIHDTDFVIHCFGMPDAVSSTGDRSHVRTKYTYEKGLSVEAVGGWFEDPDTPFTMTAEIECERGTISFSLGRTPEILVSHRDGRVTEYPEASIGGTGYDAQARALVDAIAAGLGTPPVSLDDAILAGRLLELEIDSVESGGARRSARQ